MSGQPDLWLVRHGATEWSESGRHTGRTDIPLTSAGQAGAAALYRPLDRERFEAVFTSPLVRARETARLAGFADAEVLDDLLEWNYGVYEGRTTVEIQGEIPGWTIWTHPIVDGETFDEVGARTERVLKRIAEYRGPVLCFAHGHVLRILTACALGLGPASGRRFVLDAGSVSVIGQEHGVRALRRWNWTP